MAKAKSSRKKGGCESRKKTTCMATVKLVRLTPQMIEEIQQKLAVPYNFRASTRKAVVYTQKKKRPSNKRNTHLVKNNIAPKNVQQLWTNCKKESFVIEADQFCLAKMATYSPWPAKIVRRRPHSYTFSELDSMEQYCRKKSCQLNFVWI